MEQPRWASLTPNSSREEVVAAVAEHDRRAAQTDARFAVADFGDLPPEGERRGCYWSEDRSIGMCYRDGPRDEDPVLAAQRLAEEEDQSVPGWDRGA